MNINELFNRVNRAIAECKEGISRESDPAQKLWLSGFKDGMETTLKVVNEVNNSAGESQDMLRNCTGYGDRKGLCKEKVPKKFLRLYCDECCELRLIENGRPIYGHKQTTDESCDQVNIIKFAS